jgi:hypothetical protein
LKYYAELDSDVVSLKDGCMHLDPECRGNIFSPKMFRSVKKKKLINKQKIKRERKLSAC